MLISTSREKVSVGKRTSRFRGGRSGVKFPSVTVVVVGEGEERGGREGDRGHSPFSPH